MIIAMMKITGIGPQRKVSQPKVRSVRNITRPMIIDNKKSLLTTHKPPDDYTINVQSLGENTIRKLSYQFVEFSPRVYSVHHVTKNV